MSETKVCNQCNKDKPIEQFERWGAFRGTVKRCSECRKKQITSQHKRAVQNLTIGSTTFATT